MAKIGFIGSGKMAQALMRAFIGAKLAEPENLFCSDPLASTLKDLKDSLKVHTTADNAEIFEKSEIVFLSFKPQNFPQAVADIAHSVKPHHLIISIMAGITISRIESVLPGKVVRVMPNTACLVNQMAAGYATGDNVTANDVKVVEKLLNAAGLAVRVAERELDAVTALSGSGPAFVARLIEAFTEAGTAQGLDAETAGKLARQTFIGTGQLLEQWSISPEELVTMVSSPKGTTVAGREVLEASDMRNIISQTIEAAAKRSIELGKG